MLSKSRYFSFSLIAAILAVSVSSHAQNPTPTPVVDDTPETVFTEEIKLNVSAFDLKGNFVSKVEKRDLVIVEDNRLHQANSIRRIPASVLILLDTGGQMRWAKGLRQTRNTALSLIDSLTDKDSVAVIEYSDKARILSEWTTNRAITKRALRKDLSFGKRAMFVEALSSATEVLKKSENENRHLVLISDGTDSFDRIKERDAEMRKLMTTNINVHVLSYTGLEIAQVLPKTKRTTQKAHKNPLPDSVIDGLPDGLRRVNRSPKFGAVNLDKKHLQAMRKRHEDLQSGQNFLLTLSENTSGMFILPETKEEMINKARLIAKIIDSNYVVTYTPKRPFSESKDGEIRNVEVFSRKDGLRVSARRKLIIEKTAN